MTSARVLGSLMLAALAISGCAARTRAKTDPMLPASTAAAQPMPAPTGPAASAAPGGAAQAPRGEPSAAAEQRQLTEQVSRIAGEIAELQNALAKVMATSQLHDSQLQSLNRRLDELAARSREAANSAPPGFAPTPNPAGPADAPAPASPPAPAAGASTITTSPEDLYRDAMARYESGQRDAAVLRFYELIANYPNHPVRESAQFLLANTLLTQKDYRGAIAEFESLVQALPRGSKTPEALVKIGICERALGNETRARQAWRRVIREYPGSAAARQARGLLGPS